MGTHNSIMDIHDQTAHSLLAFHIDMHLSITDIYNWIVGNRNWQLWTYKPAWLFLPVGIYSISADTWCK